MFHKTSRPLYFFICCFFMLFSCQENKTEEVPKEGVKVKKIMPARAIFNSLKGSLKNINWSKHIQVKMPPTKEEFLGFQIGYLFVNWSVATIVKDDAKIKKLSEHILDLSKAVDIDDDAILLEMKIKLDKITPLLDSKEKKSYRRINYELEYIRDLLKSYYEDKDDKRVLRQIALGTWCEFLYLGCQGLDQKFTKKSTRAFVRPRDVDHFQSMFSPYYAEEPGVQVFLEEIKEIMVNSENKTLNKVELDLMRGSIDLFRSIYL